MKAKFRRLVARMLEARVKRLLKQKPIKVVAVTGSVGKTSTKLAIAEVLKQKYKVLVHPGNFNSEIGLPLAIFDLDVPETLANPIAWLKILRQIDLMIPNYPYQLLVLEMGADQPGDIQKFIRYIKPGIGVITAIAAVHTEQFGSIDGVAREKMMLARGSRAVLVNEEDKRVMKEARELGEPVQTYGVDRGGVHWSNLKRGNNLTLQGDLHLHSGTISVKTLLVARHALAGLAAAAAVGEDLGLELVEIKKGLELIQPVAGRMRVFAGAEGSIILDDTYNSSPRSAVAALETLAGLDGRKIAILGSMNELGNLSQDGHAEVGRKAAEVVDLLVTVGEQANRYLSTAALSAGLHPDQVHPFDSPYEAGAYLRPLLKKGDVVLAKGSQNRVFAEEAVAKLLAHSSDKAQLVRQGSDWQRRKREQFEVD